MIGVVVDHPDETARRRGERERLREAERVRPAIFGELRHAAQHHAVELHGERGDGAAGRGRRALEVLAQDLLAAASAERARARQHLVGDHGQRVDVLRALGLGRERVAPNALGRHVARRAADDLRVDGAEPVAQAEIGQARAAVLVQQDVRGLDVAVHAAGAVEHVQTRRHVMHDLRGAHGWHRLMLEDVSLEARPADELHDEEAAAVFVAERVDRHDARVVELRHGARLVEEGVAELPVLGQLGVGDLESDAALELGVPGVVDRAHPSAAQQPADFVAAEVIADVELVFSHDARSRRRRILAGGQRHRDTHGSSPRGRAPPTPARALARVMRSITAGRPRRTAVGLEETRGRLGGGRCR